MGGCNYLALLYPGSLDAVRSQLFSDSFDFGDLHGFSAICGTILCVMILTVICDRFMTYIKIAGDNH